MLTVAWFSAGVSSAVATYLSQADRILHIDIDDHHPDTERFIQDCGFWFGRPIERVQSALFCTVEQACYGASAHGFINGPWGAQCTRVLKRKVRKDWESQQTEPLCYVWGFDCNEHDRCDRIRETMPDQDHVFPLVDRNFTKSEAHQILKLAGIARPAMYDLGYHNNNCVGCVKGGKGYWNKIRQDFPEVFAARAAMERAIGASCINGTYLDELDPDAGRHAEPICDECGIWCEHMTV